MTASLGSLVVSLGLDAAEFTRGLTKSEREAQRSMKQIEKDFADMGKAIGIAAAAAATAAGVMFSQVVNAAAGLDDLAEKTGASVEELSKLQQQARISGESMETIETGLVRLTKALHGTDEESQGAGKALAALGLKADDLKNKDTAESLRIVAGELAKYQDGAGKTALALDLFGKSGAQLLPILKDMAAEGALNASVTAEQAAAAEELQKTLRRFTNQVEVAKQAIGLEFVPVMNRLLAVFIETNKATGSFAQSLNAIATVSIGKFGDTYAEQIRNIRIELERTNEQQKIFGGWLAKPLLGMRESGLLASLEAAKAFQRQEALALGGTDTRGEQQRYGLPGAVQRRLNYTSPPKPGGAAKKVIDELEKDRQQQIALAGRMLKADADAMKYFADEIKKLDDAALKDREDQIRQVGKMITADAQAQVYFRGEIEKFAKEAAEANKVAAEETSVFWDEAFRNMQRSASDFIYSVMQGEFDDFGSRFKQMLDRMVADWVAAQLMMQATAFLNKNLGGANSFGSFGNIIGTVANWFSGTQEPAPVETRATGGPVYPGQEYLVGERGPEIFRPRSAGVIIPNRQMTDGRPNVNITVMARDMDSFRATLPQLAAEARNALSS
jgi:hypothetical protein